MIRTPQFWMIFALLAGALAFVHLRGETDRFPSSVPLEQFPVQIGPWAGMDIPIQSAVRDILGKGEFLSRSYSMPSAAATGTPASTDAIASATPAPVQNGTVGLFIAYFPTQRTGQSIHSPQNCLPGSGWTFDSQDLTTLPGSHGKTYRVGEYIISNGKDRDDVLYWYRSHGRTIASDYKAKWYTLLDSLRYQRTDAALVRVITTVQPGESRESAHQRVVDFAGRLDALLPAYVPD